MLGYGLIYEVIDVVRAVDGAHLYYSPRAGDIIQKAT